MKCRQWYGDYAGDGGDDDAMVEHCSHIESSHQVEGPLGHLEDLSAEKDNQGIVVGDERVAGVGMQLRMSCQLLALWVMEEGSGSRRGGH